MKEKLAKAVKQLKEESKNICPKRVTVLAGLFLFMSAIVFASIFVNATQSIAKLPPKLDVFEDILKSKGQNLEALDGDKFAEICGRDKELAFYFLRKNFLAKDVQVTLYKVKSGENYWGIAKNFGVNIDTIIGANPELKDLLARLDYELIVPTKCGVIHQVTDNDETLDVLAELYKTTVDEIRQANNLKQGRIKHGNVIFIPGSKPVYMHEDLKNLYAKRSMFRSPLSGTYTSLFGTRTHPVTGEKHGHNAVDIRASIGTWVGAAADGTVTYAGWLGNLGYTVKIRHKDGYETLYGHLSKIHVKPGDKVFSGKLIAKTGNSGRTTGPHLHFAMYRNGKSIDPMKYLW